jgi:FkbM family methyltransferase
VRRPKGRTLINRDTLSFRLGLARRLRASGQLRWCTLPFLARLDLPGRYRWLRRLAGLQPRAGQQIISLPTFGRDRVTLPLSTVVPAPEALTEALYRLWFAVYCLDQYDACRFLGPGAVVLDGGAHVGLFSRLAARLAGPTGQVLAVEPCRDHRELLRQNTTQPHAAPVTLLPRALTAQDGEITIAVVDTNFGRQAVSDQMAASVLETVVTPVLPQMVRASRVDSLVSEFNLSRLDFIKLDVEGFEAEVLQGAADSLRRFRPVVVAAAYHRPGDEQALPAQLRALTENYLIGTHKPFDFAEAQVIAVPRERLGNTGLVPGVTEI